METTQTQRREILLNGVHCKSSRKHKSKAIIPSLDIVTITKDAAVQIKRGLMAALSSHRFLLDRDAKEIMLKAGNVIERSLSPATVHRLRSANSIEGSPIIIIKGLASLEDIPMTPFRGFSDDSKVQFADATLLGFYQIMGISPIAYEYENNGHLFRNVVPNPDSKGTESSQGYDIDLGWHTDNPCGLFETKPPISAFTDHSPIPHYLGFISMRNRDCFGQSVATEILDLESVLKRLSDQATTILCEDEFQINPPPSNICASLTNVPIITRHNGSYYFRFNVNQQEFLGLTDRAKWAIEQFKIALRDAEEDVIKVKLEPGQVMVFDNYRVCHRRSKFDPGSDLTQSRWLRRCYGINSLPNECLIDQRHWPNLLR